MPDELTDEQIAQLSPGDFRNLIRKRAMVSLAKNVLNDPHGNLSLKVMVGIGEFEAAKQAIVINNFVNRVPAGWQQRYVGAGSTVPEERQLPPAKEEG